MSPRLSDLWLLESRGEAVRCEVAGHPHGMEVRYIMNEHPLITRVVSTWDEVTGIAEAWRARLEARGFLPATELGKAS